MCLGITLDEVMLSPAAEKRIPLVTQKVGKIVHAHLRQSPHCIKMGICWKMNTVIAKSPPETKCKNKVMI